MLGREILNGVTLFIVTDVGGTMPRHRSAMMIDQDIPGRAKQVSLYLGNLIACIASSQPGENLLRQVLAVVAERIRPALEKTIERGSIPARELIERSGASRRNRPVRNVPGSSLLQSIGNRTCLPLPNKRMERSIYLCNPYPPNASSAQGEIRAPGDQL